MSDPAPDTTALILLLLGPYAGDVEPGGPSPRAQAIYDELPGMYRAADDGTLLALTVAMFDIVGGIELLIRALNYVPIDEGGPGPDVVPGGRSILTDLDRPLWAPWLAQAVGVDLPAAGITGFDGAAEAIAAGINGWRAGSTEALATAARRTLTGARTVRVRAHADAGPWVITIGTAAGETPDEDALRAAVEAVLPAGHGVTFDNAVGTWDGIEALAPTNDDVDALTSDELEELYA